MTDPLVVQVLRQFKEALLLQERQQMAEMAVRYLEIERSLAASIQMLADEMALRKAQGLAVTPGALYRLNRYKVLQAQARVELQRYTRDYAGPLIARMQEQYLQLGIEAAWQALSVSAIGVSFNRLPLGAIMNMVGFTGDGAPLRKLLALAYPDAMDGMIRQLIESTARGINPRKTAALMAKGLGQGLDRVLVIARTEQLRAFRTASTAQYRESGIVQGFKRLATKDARTCMACLVSDGEVFRSNQELSDHPNGRCLAPGSVVGGPAIEAFVSRYYVGDMLTIRLASGQFLAVTPNHPVLTDRGWMAAQFIQKGDNVVCGGRLQGAASDMRPDEYQVPTRVEDIPRALQMNRFVRVPASAEDFHGDGRGSEVYVVRTNGLLRDSGNAAFGKPLGQEPFGWRRAAGFTLATLRDMQSMLRAHLGSAHRVLSDLDAAMKFLYRGTFGQQAVSLSHGAPGDTMVGQMAVNGRPRYAKNGGQDVFRLARQVTSNNVRPGEWGTSMDSGSRFSHGKGSIFSGRPEQAASLDGRGKSQAESVIASGHGLDAIAGNVVLDRVLEIDVRAFSGHVYNLQTREGWYNASGSMALYGSGVNLPIVHNCAVVPILMVGPAVQWQTGPEWFNTLDAATQERMMGAEKYGAWKEGKFALADMRKTAHSDTWGDSPRVATLSELVA